MGASVTESELLRGLLATSKVCCLCQLYPTPGIAPVPVLRHALLQSAAFPGVQRVYADECKLSLVFCLKVTCGSNMKFILRMLQQTTSEK